MIGRLNSRMLGHAQHIQRYDGHQRGQRRVDGTAQAFGDGDVHNLVARDAVVRRLRVVLTDAVEDHDRVVDGVAHDRQHRGDERRVHLDDVAQDDHEADA